MVDVVNKSAAVNTAQLVATQDGEVVVSVNDMGHITSDIQSLGPPDEALSSLPTHSEQTRICDHQEVQ